MKTVDFFGHKISRLILGDNPFNGWSYIPDEVSSEEMKAFYTDEKEIETLFAAEALGIQTMLPLSWPRTCGVLSEYYKRGGTMNLIFQGIASETPQENADHARQFAPHALAVYRNGSTLDYCCETGKFDEIRNTIKAYRDSGLIVGLASHVPSSIARAEDEDWGVDFYMTCLYNNRKGREGTQSGFITGKSKAGVIFHQGDQYEMFKIIKQLDKFCVAYKVFAGGQIFTGLSEAERPAAAEQALRETFDNIKPGDAVCLGVYEGKHPYLKQNVDLVNKILGE